MVCEIISVGTELLLGDIVNTNTQFLSQQLALIGISIYHQSVVGDNEGRLLEAIELADSRSDVIILTGGLGPTSDDITKESVAKFYQKELVICEKTLARIEHYFSNRGIVMTANNKKTAWTIEGAKQFDNDNGTAPGILVEEGTKRIILLPGPPNELIPMFESLVRPYLEEITNHTVISRTLKLINIGESEAAYKIQDIIDQGINPTVAPYAKLSEVHLRITAQADCEEEGLKIIDGLEGQIRERLGKYIFTTEDQELEEVLVAELNNRNLKIATAESITGGLIGATLVNVNGASNVFDEGIITYSNDAKMRQLNVKEETLKQYGAVSEEVAKEMAMGVCNRTGADVGLSVTGIAGPTGGTDLKPVGLTYIGICINGETKAYKYEFLGNRDKNRKNAAKKALIIAYNKVMSS